MNFANSDGRVVVAGPLDAGVAIPRRLAALGADEHRRGRYALLRAAPSGSDDVVWRVEAHAKDDPPLVLLADNASNVKFETPWPALHNFFSSCFHEEFAWEFADEDAAIRWYLSEAFPERRRRCGWSLTRCLRSG